MPTYLFPSHPGDLFRNNLPQALPNPDADLDAFLVAFLDHYQSDERVALLNDLYKLKFNEFETVEDELAFRAHIVDLGLEDVDSSIQKLEFILRREAESNLRLWAEEGRVLVW